MSSARRLNPRSRGFSLTELLVVIGIIILILGIAMPTLILTRRSAEIAKAKADLGAISMALEQYKNDFKDYPRPPNSSSTNRVLAKALIAAGSLGQDGQDGPGFRTIPGGKVWGPYLATDKFKLGNSDTDILDSFGTPIEYYPRWKSPEGATIRTPPPPKIILMSNNGMFSYAATTDANSRFYLQRQLGDEDVDGDIEEGSEKLKHIPPFLLISAGLDKAFSSVADLKDNRKSSKLDDITNLAP